MNPNEFRRELARLYAQGRSARREIDALVGQHTSDRREDLNRLFACATERKLRSLRTAISEGRLVRRQYWRATPQGEHGCIVSLLFGHRSSVDFFDHKFPDHPTFAAVVRVVRAWDYDELSVESLTSALDEFLQKLESTTRGTIVAQNGVSRHFESPVATCSVAQVHQPA